MYYIYHIKGIKIGVSTNPKQRVERQGYTEYEILEEHTCIDTVSNRELELQKQYGYKVDNVSYKSTYNQRKKYRTKENCSKGGKKGGKSTGNRIKNGELIGFHLTNLSLSKEELYKQRTKGAVKKRILTPKQIEFVKKTYYKAKTQYDIIPPNKMTSGQLASHFNVGKHIILRALKF